jgi:hypothetical protein
MSGSSAIVGAPGANSGSGVTYIYVKSSGEWPTAPTLTLQEPPAAGGDEFGTSVSVSGKTAVIGASGPDGGEGTAYIYTKGP